MLAREEFILIARLTDNFSRLNELNLYLQGTEGVSIF